MAYLFWDRAGFLWSALERKWPQLENSTATPEKTVFRLELDHTYELIAGVSSARIIAHRPRSNLEDFSSLAHDFLNLVQETLEVHEYTRIGFRLIHFLKTQTLDQASESVLATNLVHPPSDKCFGIDPDTVLPEAIITMNGDQAGARIHLACQTRKYSLVLPAEIRLEKLKGESVGVLFDVDYYTIATATAAQVHFKEWIHLNQHQIRRDSRKIFERR